MKSPNAFTGEQRGINDKGTIDYPVMPQRDKLRKLLTPVK